MSHFNFYKENVEKKLYNDMQDEFCEQFGVPCKYFRRTFINPDRLFGEDPSSIFREEDGVEVRLFVEDGMAFGGADEMYTKFGLTVDNTINFFVQHDRIHKKIGGRPFSGDIIYVPMFNRLFEIIEPEEKASFFLFGRMMTYKLSCKLMDYSQEQMQTTVDEIDALNGETSIDDLLTDNRADTSPDVMATIDFDEKNPFSE